MVVDFFGGLVDFTPFNLLIYYQRDFETGVYSFFKRMKICDLTLS